MSTQTPLTYYGGKQSIAAAIVALLPPHDVYLEPFAGGAAVLFAKPRAARETINDLDGDVVRFWRAVRESPEALSTALAATPYSREEWRACHAGLGDEDVDDVEAARRLVVTIDQSFARCGDTWSPPSLARDRRGRWQPVTWANLPRRLLAAVDRLSGVAVECGDAVAMLSRWDLPGALIYADPPYDGEHRTRTRRRDGTRGYRHDTTPTLWRDLVDELLQLKHAAVALSGYPCDETAALEHAGWSPTRIPARKSSASKSGSTPPSVETLWRNPACVAGTAQGSLLAAIGGAA